MSRTLLLGLAALSSLGLAHTAFAQEARPATPDAVSPAALQSALRYLDTLDFDRNARAAMETMTGILLESMARRFQSENGRPFPPELASEFKTILNMFMQRRFTEQLPMIKQRSAMIYAGHFSAAELDRLTALMNDPAMRKLTALQPTLMPQLGRVSEFTQKDRQELEALVRSAVDRWAAKQPKPDSKS